MSKGSCIPTAYLAVAGDRFVDGEGRQVLLHGLNVVGKSKAENYATWHRAEDFAAMRKWGMNCVRLGITWDALEPKPGEYDETYLDAVKQRVDAAAAHGLLVLLDMHQDLYSSKYGDGAPDWATLDANAPHQTGAVWSDAYMLSPAVQVAFDSFWNNMPTSDGVGIQDHYAAAWAHVAKRFAENKTIIGYDLMNEPFEGTSIQASQLAWLTSEGAGMLVDRLQGKIHTRAELPQMWLDPDGRNAIMRELQDVELYKTFLKAQQPHSQAFERERLQPMYQRVANAIRAVDTSHILFLETSSSCNSGVPSGIEPVKGADGKRDPQQAYAPHAYDIVVDTSAVAEASQNRVELILARHQETATRLNMPMMIGEWGAYGEAGGCILPAAQFMARQIERHNGSDTFWEYYQGLEEKPYLAAIHRSIPCRLAGKLDSYSNDPETGEFSCRWNEAEGTSAPTMIYLTAKTVESGIIRLSPEGKGYLKYPASSGSKDVYIVIPPTGGKAERVLSVARTP